MSSATALPRAGAEPSEFREGWPIVLACFCAATFAWGFGFYGQSVYLAELQQTHGWSASLIASATTVYYLAGAFLLTLVHRVIAFIGPRAMLAAGAVILGAGVIGLSRAEVPWQLFACSMVMAAGWACTTTTAIATTLAHWFDRRRGMAISLALNGASTGGFVIAPLLVRFGHGMGLEKAVPIWSGCACGVAAGGAGWRRAPAGRWPTLERADPQGRRPCRAADLPLLTSQSQVLGNLHFWLVSVPFALALAAQVGFIVHQVAFLLPRLGSHGAGIAIASTAIAATAGRWRWGCDRPAEPAPRLGRQLRQSGCRAGADAGAARHAGRALRRQHRVRIIGRQRHHAALADHPEGICRAVLWPGGRPELDGRAGDAGVWPALLGLAHDLTGGYAAALILCIVLQLAGSIMLLVGPRSPPR